MEGVHGWIGRLDIVFAAYFSGILFRQVFFITFHLLSDRGFKVFKALATECSVVLLFRQNQNIGKLKRNRRKRVSEVILYVYFDQTNLNKLSQNFVLYPLKA